jgi:hypothetical protein
MGLQSFFTTVCRAAGLRIGLWGGQGIFNGVATGATLFIDGVAGALNGVIDYVARLTLYGPFLENMPTFG